MKKYNFFEVTFYIFRSFRIRLLISITSWSMLVLFESFGSQEIQDGPRKFCHLMPIDHAADLKGNSLAAITLIFSELRSGMESATPTSSQRTKKASSE